MGESWDGRDTAGYCVCVRFLREVLWCGVIGKSANLFPNYLLGHSNWRRIGSWMEFGWRWRGDLRMMFRWFVDARLGGSCSRQDDLWDHDGSRRNAYPSDLVISFLWLPIFS